MGEYDSRYNLPSGLVAMMNYNGTTFDLSPGSEITIPCPRVLAYYAAFCGAYLGIATAQGSVQTPALAPGSG